MNRGCIPTKSLLKSASIFKQVESADSFGITVEKIAIDFSKVRKRKEYVTRQLLNGIKFLMKKNKINVINGTGKIIEKFLCLIEGKEIWISIDETGKIDVKFP